MMQNAYRAGKAIRDSPEPECEVSGPVQEISSNRAWPTASLRFSAFSKRGDIEGLPSSRRGTRFRIDGGNAQLNFDCVSSRVRSTPAIPLTVRVGFTDQWTPRKGAVGREYPKDVAAVLHSAATSVARKLECSDNGGLPARSEDLKAVPPRK
ncbi:hypothetical protein [Streptomyces sp. NBC_00239]|uniref:hypothetical protein n=1 Tax=Streptomyces sp. NBC_00239 TaxID=2903640 RepID=UPI002E2E3B2E|nr:hypothetical protein [Streptomyces sp. NBC_00239]